jgi:L-iditol 2-dehydrogenase
MKKAVLTNIGQIELQETAKPEIVNDTDVLLRISHVGICGSDLHYYKEGKIGDQIVNYPFTIGHECSAVIDAIGPDVTNVHVGQSVFVEPAIPCQQCTQCKEGKEHICPNVQFLGAAGQLSGGMAEYIVMPSQNCFPLPQNISLTSAVLIEPLSIAYHAVRYMEKLKREQDIAILGVGPIGLSVCTVLNALHRVRIFATDKLDYRLEMSKKMGAFWVGNPNKGNISNKIIGIAPNLMDIVFECAGEQETLDQAIEVLKPGGKLVIVGIPSLDRISFDIDVLRRKEITIFNVRRQNHAVLPIMKLLQENKINADNLITHHMPIKQISKLFDLVAGYRDSVIKALVQVS